jgi:mannose-6-phosphate isomerase-like protein (cupin superfamily)
LLNGTNLPRIAALLATAATRPAEPHGFGEIRWLIAGALDPGATMTIGVCRVDAGKLNPLHVHPNCDEALYVISGRCRKRIGSQSVEMGPGDCIRIPRGQPHKAETLGSAPMVCLIAYDTPRREVVFLEGPQAKSQ